jgi:hypothetical protein
MVLSKMRSAMIQPTTRTRFPLRSTGSMGFLGVVVVIALFAVSIVRCPESMPSARGLLEIDVFMLLLYGAGSLWAAGRRSADTFAAAQAGGVIGLLAGVILAANHAIELFVLDRPFALVIIPVLLIFALLGATGSVAWQRTHSLVRGLISGLACAVIATLVLLTVGFALNLAFEARAEIPLQDAFSKSGMSTPGAYLVRNSLEAASEALIRMPVLALLLSLFGALASAGLGKGSRIVVFAAMWTAPVFLIAGAALLWHANALERSARPPFILGGVLLASGSLAASHAIWCAYRKNRIRAVGSGISHGGL